MFFKKQLETFSKTLCWKLIYLRDLIRHLSTSTTSRYHFTTTSRYHFTTTSRSLIFSFLFVAAFIIEGKQLDEISWKVPCFSKIHNKYLLVDITGDRTRITTTLSLRTTDIVLNYVHISVVTENISSAISKVLTIFRYKLSRRTFLLTKLAFFKLQYLFSCSALTEKGLPWLYLLWLRFL